MAWAEFSVLTPERVSLQYDIAGIGSRGTAALVDTVVQAVALTVLFIALAAGLVAIPGSLGAGGSTLALGLVALAILVITSGYFILFEILWSGQTPGKRWLGIRVIRENGYPLRPVDAVIRNLVRIVDWLPVGYAVGVAAMLLNNRSKRLGDFASGTIVIREGKRSLGPTHGVPTATQPPRGFTLSNADATLVRDFLVRRGSMAPAARDELARRLAGALSQRYGLTRLADTDAEDFLETLA